MDSTASTPANQPTPSVPLTITDEQNSALLTDTLNLLGAKTPDGKQALTEIDRWIEVLKATERTGLAKVTQELQLVREQLSSPDTDTHDLAETLASLGIETGKVAEETTNDYAAPLAQLGKTLMKLGSQLSK
ncbi:hypothetical protein [Hymenobacter actinosclerus]|uniref:Uncharacterized protein n=1 Tax=Hymenobacter actinosclerus TaxID=82805 RepID=A0A1I0IZ64_9BACT|nr:hypothetical protein [Hymenobacter actinosclerus]SEU02744.1 hypothetical protein SAMN04487998_3554 [Hymenobacter actinosclerus]